MQIHRLATTVASISALAWCLDYYIVNHKSKVRYCNENAKDDLLGTFSQRNGEELRSIDHYRTTIDLKEHNNQQVAIEHFANSFFTSPLLEFAFPNNNINTSTQDIDKLKFNVGDSISIFKVIERRDNELILRTPWGSLSWMKLMRNGNEIELNFGSGLLKNEKLANMPLFGLGMRFHQLYSRYLLVFAKRNLMNKFIDGKVNKD